MSSPDDAPVMDGDRFTVITETDHTGVIWIVSILCFIYTLMVFGLRLEARRNNFGLDDVLAIIATVLASVQYILIFVANSRGLGRSYGTTVLSDIEVVGQYILASQVLTLIALGLAKCSVISLCRRLFTAHQKSHRLLCDIGMGLCAIWSVASILAISIDCSPVRLLGYASDFCPNLVTRWTAVGTVDSILEIAIVLLAFDGLFPLQMSLARKFQAAATFVLRLILVVFAGLHISTLRTATLSENRGVALTKPTVYLQIELLYALLSASIPALNRWLRNFDTSMGSAWMYGSQAYAMSNNSKQATGRSGSVSYALQPVDKSETVNKRISLIQKDVSRRTSANVKSGEFVPAGPKYVATTTTYAISQNSDALEITGTPSTNSDDMIIRKDVQWQVQYEGEGSQPRTPS